jgi:hypothetical protein
MANIPEFQKAAASLADRIKRMSAAPKRDPKRISGLLKALEDVWRDNPDWRLGQLIVNAARANSNGRQLVCPEIFYLEDKEMLKGIESLAKRRRNAES